MKRKINMVRVLSRALEYCNEKGVVEVLETILDEFLNMTKADAGSLYVCKEEALYFNIMKNKTLKEYNTSDEKKVQLPPVLMTEENVCSYVALHNEIVRIEDVYHDKMFCKSGPKKYDEMTGYHTKSMLVVPITKVGGIVIGVLQLINAKNENGEIVPFCKEDADYFSYHSERK